MIIHSEFRKILIWQPPVPILDVTALLAMLPAIPLVLIIIGEGGREGERGRGSGVRGRGEGEGERGGGRIREGRVRGKIINMFVVGGWGKMENTYPLSGRCQP